MDSPRESSSSTCEDKENFIAFLEKKPKTLSDTESEDEGSNDEESEDEFQGDITKAYTQLCKEYCALKKDKMEQDTKIKMLKSERDLMKTEMESLSGKLLNLEEERMTNSQRAEKFKAKLEAKNRKIEELEESVGAFQTEIHKLNVKIKDDAKILEKLTNSSNMIDEIWSKQKFHGDKSGLGYTEKKQSVASSSSNSPPNATKGQPKINPPTTTLRNSPKQNSRSPPKMKGTQFFKPYSFVPTCHHCGIKGHIRPNCYKLYGPPLNYVKKFYKSQNPRFQTSSNFFKNNFKNSCQFQKSKNLNFEKLFAKPRQFLKTKYQNFQKSKILNFYERCEKNQNFDKIIFPKIRTIWVRKSDLNVVHTPTNVEGVNLEK